MWGDTGLVEYSLVYEQIHVLCGNGLNTKSVCCARRIAVQCVRTGMYRHGCSYGIGIF